MTRSFLSKSKLFKNRFYILLSVPVKRNSFHIICLHFQYHSLSFKFCRVIDVSFFHILFPKEPFIVISTILSIKIKINLFSVTPT